MTIVQLEYIVAVDTYRSFNKAASSCFVTQPTLSLQIQKLEDLLGVKLFDRNQQPVTPTKIGAEIIERARLLLNDYKKIKEIAQDEHHDVAGELAIGVITTVAPYLMPHLLNRFRIKYPGIRLMIWEETTEQIVHKLKLGLIDCGIVSTPLNENQFLETTLYSEKFVAYVGDKSRLVKNKLINPADIHPTDLWLLEEGHCMREQILDICQKRETNGFQHYAYHTGSLETLRRMVDENGGATILPELMLRCLSNERQKNVRYFNAPEPVRYIGLITAKNPIKRRLIDQLKRETSEFVKVAGKGSLTS
ncbi:hydrogen peroxide-inducible genes activator [Spirosoma flavus]